MKFILAANLYRKLTYEPKYILVYLVDSCNAIGFKVCLMCCRLAGFLLIDVLHL